MSLVTVAQTCDKTILRLLTAHPKVSAATTGPNLLDFNIGPWPRRIIRQGLPPTDGLCGLVELVDNNPMVCADEFILPSIGASLALIALGPVALTDIIVESPTIIANVVLNDSEIALALAEMGWTGGVVTHHEELPGVNVAATTVMVAIRSPESLDEIREAFDERFGRSFYVKESVQEPWDQGLVFAKPEARYRLSLALDTPNSLLTIRVVADYNGKVGAGQVIHAMNVMCGFEESLGVF